MIKFFNKFLSATMLIALSLNVGATDFSIVYLQFGKVPYLLAETDQGYRFGIGHTEQSVTCMDLKFMVLDIYPKDALREKVHTKDNRSWCWILYLL